jgi:hypothetical protein
MNPSTSVKSKVKSFNDSSVSSNSSKASGGKMPTLGGISIVEIAVLGAAGFVLWKNREKISSLLEDNGITAPAILSSDLSEIIQSGVSMIGNRFGETAKTGTTSSSRRHDA